MKATHGVTLAGENQAEALRQLGWHVADVQAATPAAFVDAVGVALGFPAYYGKNLDALADCLSDRTRPTAVVWNGWQFAAVADPRRWARLLAVLEDAGSHTPPFTVLLLSERSVPDAP